MQPSRARLGLDVATHCPGLVFGAHSTKIPAFPADFAHFAKPLKDKVDLALFSSCFGLVPGAGMEFSVDSGRFSATWTGVLAGAGARSGSSTCIRPTGRLVERASRGASSSVARTGKRKAGGLARVQSRQARLSAMYAKRLARSQAASRRKTPASDELPWWARPRPPGQR